MKLEIKWTDDCQGKKDYDGDIVAVSTRYWPKSYQSNSKVSAKCNIILSDGFPHHNGEIECLVSAVFEGDSFPEVSAQVELWAQNQMDRVSSVLLAEFNRAA